MKNIIFDLDNTLVDCSIYYIERQEQLADIISERTKIPKSICLNIFKQIDLACTDLEHGFNKERFPRSFAATSAALDLISGTKINEDAAEQAYLLGKSVFDAPYPLYDGALDILKKLKEDGYKLLLCSKGDYDVQQRKIEINGLYDFFSVDRIYIVPKKNTTVLTKIIDDHDLIISDTLMIGDSIRDDIAPAAELGMHTIWVQGTANTSWAYENSHYKPEKAVNNINEILNFIPVNV